MRRDFIKQCRHYYETVNNSRLHTGTLSIGAFHPWVAEPLTVEPSAASRLFLSRLSSLNPSPETDEPYHPTEKAALSECDKPD